MGFVIFLILTALLAVIIRDVYSLCRNYKSAKELGLPTVICPIDNHRILWLLNQVWLLPLLRKLPKKWNGFTKYLEFGWQYADRRSGKASTHESLGPAIVLVTPGKNQIIVSDPVAIHDMLNRYRVFDKPWMYKIHDLYGMNVDTVNGGEWVRHRKITAPAFNEKVSRTVWEEASRQAQAMLDISCGAGIEDEKAPYTTLYQDTKTIAMHVLMHAGVGVQQNFSGGTTKPAGGHTMPLVESLNAVLEMLPLPWLCSFAPNLFRSSFFPKVFRDGALAYNELEAYLNAMIMQERPNDSKQQDYSNDSHRRANLLESLMKASDDAEDGTKYRLSVDDVRGNLYIFYLAGHETTANALCFTISLLAAYPQWQDWISAEIDAVGKDLDSYERTFSKMKRCLALMYEVLRLYPSVTFMPRGLASTPAQIPLSDGKHINVSSQDTVFEYNMYDMSFHKETWGDDVFDFRPDRFIIPPHAESGCKGWLSQGHNDILGEELVFPPSNRFMPWSAGPRVCPGMKFAQVEFVSVICTLFSQARVDVAVPANQDRNASTIEMARRSLHKTIEDAALKGSTFQMNHPENIRLQWFKRK